MDIFELLQDMDETANLIDAIEKNRVAEDLLLASIREKEARVRTSLDSLDPDDEAPPGARQLVGEIINEKGQLQALRNTQPQLPREEKVEKRVRQCIGQVYPERQRELR